VHFTQLGNWLITIEFANSLMISNMKNKALFIFILATASKGQIALQAEGPKVEFKRLNLSQITNLTP